MSKEERKEQALKLKGNHKLYIEILKDCPDEDIINSVIVADLSDCTKPSKKGGRWLIPDYTPDWLNPIIKLYGGYEVMESVFEFDNKEIIEELKEIGDVIEVNGKL